MLTYASENGTTKIYIFRLNLTGHFRSNEIKSAGTIDIRKRVEYTGSEHCPTCMVIMPMNSISFMRIIIIASCTMFVFGLFKITEPKIVYSTE